jgi:hypothetical protein
MKYILAALCLSLTSMMQSQSWLWENRFDTGSDENPFNALAADDFGNVYTTVQFEGLLTVGTTTFQSNPIEDVCLTKMDSTGNVLWAIAFGGPYWDQVNGMDCDAEGNVYLAGHFEGSLHMGDTTIVGSTGTDIFLMRVNTDGSLGWIQVGSNIWNEEASDVKVDHAGDIVMCGSANNTSIIGSMQLLNENPDVFNQDFIAKFSAQGDPIWIRSAASTQSAIISFGQSALAIGPDNSIHLSNFRIGGFDFAGVSEPGPGNNNVIVLKWDSEGTPLWGWVGLNDFNDFVYDLAVDQQGRIYLLVNTLTSFQFAGQSIQFTAGTIASCLLRLLPDGSEDAVWPLFSPSDSQLRSIACSPQNEMWIGGFLRNSMQTPFGFLDAYGNQYDRDGFLLKFDANSDTFAGYTNITGEGWQFIRDIDISNTGFVFAGADITGYLGSPVYFGIQQQLTDAMEANGQTQPVVCRLDSVYCSLSELLTMELVSICQNASSTLQLDIPVYSVLWSDGSQSSEYGVDQPGTIGVTAITQQGCILRDSVVVESETAPQLNWVLQPISCAGALDGSITIEVFGANPPYALAWNGVSVSNQFGEIGAGLYTLEATSDAGCVSSALIEMTEPDPLQVDYTTSFNDASGLGSVAIIQVIGGTPPYTVFWPSHPQAEYVLEGVGAGSYVLQVSDAAGCLQEFNLLLTTAISEVSGFEMKCYPQPASNVVTVEAQESFIWKLLDGIGNTLLDAALPNVRHSIDVSHLSAGFYVLMVSTANGPVRAVELVKH